MLTLALPEVRRRAEALAAGLDGAARDAGGDAEVRHLVALAEAMRLPAPGVPGEEFRDALR
ncbi:MAG: hypothetical protein M3Q27_00420, partial [Actinomycetota bacterium]|nr:hypothetical protein [Actinomycetota bacterium]